MMDGYALDEVTSILLQSFYVLSTATPPRIVSAETVMPLCTIIPTIAARHSDPESRHQMFRLLGMILDCTEWRLRMEVLKELLTDEELPAMKAAAIGLLKDALLKGLAAGEATPIASPLFLQTFASIIWKHRQVEWLGTVGIEEFRESGEVQRLSESLSFLYIAVMRDAENKVCRRLRCEGAFLIFLVFWRRGSGTGIICGLSGIISCFHCKARWIGGKRPPFLRQRVSSN